MSTTTPGDVTLVDPARRRFVATGGAIVALFAVGADASWSQSAPTLPLSLRTNRRLGGWIRIQPDDTVTVFTGKAELDQGILTALAQIAPEELEMPMARLHVVSADTSRSADEGYTYGSQSLEQSGTALRVTAAEARWRLTRVAATRFEVDQDRLRVEDGAVIAPDGRRASYWSLVSGSEDLLALEIVGNIAPKAVSTHRILGTAAARLDLPAKVSGGAAFIQDLRLPGMLYGRVVRPRAYHARLVSLDDAKMRAMPGGVTVVRHGSFPGVVARREEQAIAARAALAAAATWDAGTALPVGPPLADTLKTWPAEVSVVGQAGQDRPAPTAGRRLQAVYSRPYMSQASLGPESFVDEPALLAGVDPAAFRVAHLANPRAKAVIDAVVARTNWSAQAQSRPGDGRHGRGLAFARYKNIGAYAAIVVDIKVDAATGAIRVAHVTAAIDVGQIVNPDGLSNQIEGGIVQALGWTLKESVRFDEHSILTRDWASYPVMRFPDVPPIDVLLIDHPELPVADGGEASSGPASAAVANAFAHATGQRMRDLPMTPDKVRALLAAPATH